MVRKMEQIIRQAIDRESGAVIQESVYGDRQLRLLYTTPWGGLLRTAYVTRPMFSARYGKRMRRPSSIRLIPDFIAKNKIDTADYKDRAWTSFTDFFIREPKAAKRPWPNDSARLGSPADARLSVYKIADDSLLWIKGFSYTVEQLLGEREDGFAGGLALVFRLTVADIHRYYYPDNCLIQRPVKRIPGRLHTVGPHSDGRVPVLRENSRVVNYLRTEQFGLVAMLEVGALTIGSIVNHPREKAQRGAEKGWFEPGGSTIVLLFEPGRILVDRDILDWCQAGYEVRVLIGEGIATRVEATNV
ncbi:MAG: phosphatidylserine decarboxylase [Fastidiosipilaceae bacterium]|jgi:phosphatidylserine decarboxylase